ncbi:MAG: hypothetical protein PWR29_1861, partial [Methanolobus sp.]|nr:hypothetical protein [Methanolobus sp.]
ATWTLMNSSSGWSARYDHSSVVLPDGSIVLIGGADSEGLKNDVWRSTNNGATWTLINSSSGWSARYDHSSVVLPDGGIVLMGGWAIEGSSACINDTWRLTTAGSLEQHPSHTYTEAGTYQVTLQAYNSQGYNSTIRTDYITVEEAPFVATTVNASSTSIAYNENDIMTVDSGISVNGSSTFTSARVYIGDGYVQGEDFLRFTNTSSISGSFNPLTGILSLTGSGNAADYQEAFRSVRYENINDDPNTSYRNITFVMGDNAVYLESTGHYYESVYSESAVSWTDAKAAAEARSLSGMQGYLATILTEEESVFLGSKAPDNAWIGANDIAVEGEWRWVTGPENLTGEGTPFYYQGNQTTVPGFYTNWNSGEPNNSGDTEHYGQILGAGNKKWNDLPNVHDVYYYLVEYGGMPNETAPQLTATITISINSINDAPSTPGNFTSPLAGDSVERGSTINVSWGGSTDPENDAIKYNLWYFNGTWTQIADMLEVTSFNFAIPIEDISQASFKVYANDSLVNSTENNVTFTLTSIIPGSDFTVDVTSGLAPLTVNFTYDPSHYPTGLVWDFGDGSNSTEQNPVHTYSTPGTYTVSLNASNLGGHNITTKAAYITAAYVPVASFTADVTSGDVPLTVNFTDTSQNDPTGWFWNFGDGTNSTEQNPTHVYTSVGTYTVTLNATNAGGSNTSMQTDYITTAEMPVANFTSDVTTGAVPLVVNFIDQSENSPTSWFWDFGDGTNSTERNATHTYTSAGTFIVNLTATNVGGSNISTQTIIADVVPVASFTANATSGALPLAVGFTDQSINATAWYWEFGDGVTSTVQNPVHTYAAVGSYTVNLTAINSVSGNDSLTRTAYITVAIAPVANFTASATSGTAPFTVSFTDNSTNTPTAWSWDFGDGAISSAQNPTHTYTSAGTYTVSLNASNAGGYNVSTLAGYITVTSASSGGSDSGRRVSVSPGQPPESVTSTYTSVKHVMGGTNVEYDLSGTDSPVLGISFDAKDNEGIVVAKVQVLSDRPEGVSVPPGKQYQLMSIDVGSEGTISSHNADNIRINFKVSWDWIKENNIDPSTIRLTRYHEGGWQELPTGKVSDDGQFIHFVAETPGFSIFSVVGDALGATQGEKPVDASFSEEATEVPLETEERSTPGFTGLMGLLFVAVACLASRRSKL